MGQGSFARWRAAHARCGLVAGVPDYPTLDDLRAMLARFGDAFAFDEEYALDCGGARGLIAHLRGIGAVVPGEGRAPLSPGDLRRGKARAIWNAGCGRTASMVSSRPLLWIILPIVYNVCKHTCLNYS